MLEIAREYLDQDKNTWSDQAGAARSSSPSLIELTVSDLEHGVGEEAAAEVLTWAFRNFVRVSSDWSAWQSTFTSLATSIDGRAAHPLTTRPDLIEAAAVQLERAVLRHFGRDVWQEDLARRQIAERTPLSDLESRLIAYEADVIDPADYVPPFPDLDAAETATWRERTRATWSMLSEFLPPPDREALLRWARQVASDIGAHHEFGLPSD